MCKELSLQEVIKGMNGHSVNSLKELCELVNKFDIELLENSDYVIQIEGKGYASSITSGFAQSLIDTQQAFNKICMAFETGKLPQRLSGKYKDQLVFEFQKGCTLVKIKECLNSLKECLREASGMSDFKISVICLTIALIFSGFIGEWIYSQHIELEKFKTEKQRDYLIAELLSDNKAKAGLQAAQQADQEIQDSFKANAPLDKIESLSFNGKKITKDEIRDFQAQSKEEVSTLKTISTEFSLRSLDIIDPEHIRFSAIVSKHKIKLMANKKPLESELFEENSDVAYLDSDEIEKLVDSMLNDAPVKLTVRMEFDSSNKMKRGTIIGFAD